MLKINLTPARTDRRKNLILALMSASFLGLCLLVLPVVTGLSSEPRPLDVEEQEVVVAVTQRLETRVPELSNWLKDFRVSVSRDDLDTQVRPRGRGELVSLSGQTLTFSGRFFDADSAQQEQSLLQALVTLRSQQEPENDIAFAHQRQSD